MGTQEYLAEVLRTYAGPDECEYKLNLSALGLTGEAGEVADAVKKHLFQGHSLDTFHLVEELGDILWYIALACSALDTTIDEVMHINVSKLRLRYPEGFDPERSRNR